jgi:hypothetical protein
MVQVGSQKYRQMFIDFRLYTSSITLFEKKLFVLLIEKNALVILIMLQFFKKKLFVLFIEA